MCTVCWRTEARGRIGVLLLQMLLAAAGMRAGVGGAGDTPPVAVQRESCNEPLCYTASSLQAERNRMLLQDIHIIDTTRGIPRIQADQAEANGQDLGNSAWVLTGHVLVLMPQGKLSADRATVQFVNKRISSVSAQGMPAEFEHSVAAVAAIDAAQDGAVADGARGGRGALDSARGHARQI